MYNYTRRIYTGIATCQVENKTTFPFQAFSPLEPTGSLASARTVRQPEPMVVPRFNLAIPTPVRSKAGWAMRMIVACARTVVGLEEREINSEAVRERDRRRWDGRTGLDRGKRTHSQRSR